MALVRSPPPWRVHSQLTSRRLCSLIFELHCNLKVSGPVNQKLKSDFSPHRLQKKKGSCLYQSVTDVDAEEGVDNSLLEILKLMFGQDFEAEVCSRYCG